MSKPDIPLEMPCLRCGHHIIHEHTQLDDGQWWCYGQDCEQICRGENTVEMAEQPELNGLMSLLKEDIAKTTYNYEEVMEFLEQAYPPGWQNSREGIAKARFNVINGDIPWAIDRQQTNTKEVSTMVDNRSNEVPQEQSSLLNTDLATNPPQELGASVTDQFAQMLEDSSKISNLLVRPLQKSSLGHAKIGPKNYITIEGWGLVCQFFRSEFSPEGEPIETRDKDGKLLRVQQTAILKRRDGTIINRVTASCGRDEPMWKHRPEHALSSMAQTRACSKSARLAYSWVLLLDDAFAKGDWSVTPYEEMPEGEDHAEVVFETKSINHASQEYIPDQEHVVCAECGSPMRQRNGVNGPFLGCSNYPACKHTQNMSISDKEEDLV